MSLEGRLKLRGNKNALGKTHVKTEEHKRKLSEAKKGIRNPRWQNNLTIFNLKIRNSRKMKEWKKAIFERDNYTCQKTGCKKEKLIAHHIKNFSQYSELRFSISNGITLSKESHEEFHKKYGFYNNTLEQIEEFIGKKLSYPHIIIAKKKSKNIISR